MGYTHYWSLRGDVSEEEWRELLPDIDRIVSLGATLRSLSLAITAKFILAPGTSGSPRATRTFYEINGVDEDEHEPFTLPLGNGFCKTAGKPYDVVVTAILAFLKTRLGDRLSVRSDGNEKDWKEGLLLAAACHGETVPWPVDRVDE